MIPSVIAYAGLAGIAPAHGLYAALAGLIAYAMFASSRQVVTGPDVAITLLVSSAVGPLAGGDPSRAAGLAAVAALLGAELMLLAAWLHAGIVADFLSKPVLVGYMTGAELILVSTHLGKFFGIGTTRHDSLPLLAEMARRLGETHPLTFGLGAGLIAYRFCTPLFFANAEHFVQRIRQLIASSPHPVRCFVVDIQAVWEVDVTATEALSRLADELRQREIALRIARANRPLREKL